MNKLLLWALAPLCVLLASTASAANLGTWTDAAGGVHQLQGVSSAPLVVVTTDKSGAITTGGTAQAAIAANTSRKAWCIQNDPAATETLWVRVNGTAAANVGTGLSPGAQVCNPPGMIDTAAVSVFAATTAHKWSGSEQQ
jgi:hypothetical protein